MVLSLVKVMNTAKTQLPFLGCGSWFASIHHFFLHYLLLPFVLWKEIETVNQKAILFVTLRDAVFSGTRSTECTCNKRLKSLVALTVFTLVRANRIHDSLTWYTYILKGGIWSLRSMVR